MKCARGRSWLTRTAAFQAVPPRNGLKTWADRGDTRSRHVQSGQQQSRTTSANHFTGPAMRSRERKSPGLIPQRPSACTVNAPGTFAQCVRPVVAHNGADLTRWPVRTWWKPTVCAEAGSDASVVRPGRRIPVWPCDRSFFPGTAWAGLGAHGGKPRGRLRSCWGALGEIGSLGLLEPLLG
jgi:hypothetical protein